jgi:predicted dehydrogenase
MSENKLRVGVIGAGNCVRQIHLPNLYSHPGVEVVGVSVNREQNSRLETLLDSDGFRPRIWQNAAELAQTPFVDAMVIASPNDRHFPYVMAALKAGKHVLCEKPCGLSCVQTQELAEEAHVRPNQVAHVNYIFRFLDGVERMRRVITAAQLGAIQEVTFTSVTNSANTAAFQPSSWRNDAKRGGGVWADMGSHCVDLAVHLFGGLELVEARLTGKDGLPIGEGEVDYDAHVTYYVGGMNVPVKIWVSQCHAGDEPKDNRTMVVRGTAGSLVLSLTRGNRLNGRPELVYRPLTGVGGEVALPRRDPEDRYAPRLAFDEFVQACQGATMFRDIGGATLFDAANVQYHLEEAANWSRQYASTDPGDRTVRSRTCS